MQAHISKLIAVGQISHASSEPFIKQANGVLTLAYSNIKPNAEYVYFTTKDDEKLYTAANIETRTSRFLHPYKVFGDFFVGRIPFIFIFWIILSILLDVIGFISFDNASSVPKKYWNVIPLAYCSSRTSSSMLNIPAWYLRS